MHEIPKSHPNGYSAQVGWNKPTGWTRRAQGLAAFALLFVLMLLFFSTAGSSSSGSSTLPNLFSSNPSCPNERWEDGKWVQRPPPHETMAGKSDVFRVSGFTGCATYDWTPNRGGCTVAPFDKKEFILRLMRRGGWMFIGDETTEQQFFSLSCLLHPHVRASPTFPSWGGWKASWPQFLYLNLADPWAKSLVESHMPIGFRPELTPLVSYLRVDLLFSKPELADVGAWTSHPTADPTTFFSGDGGEVFTQSALDWLGAYDAKYPAGKYNTLVLSSGGHWVPSLFKGLPGGSPEVLRLWRVAMHLLTARLVAMLNDEKNKTRVVLFRSAVQGHESCKEEWSRKAEPLTRPRELKKDEFNWKALPEMNAILEEIIKGHNHPRLKFLRLDRPAHLRPEAHVYSDCARYVVGSGIVEDWNIYMSHYERWEVDYPK
ncbi:hypothetical protein BKA62DRAFT_714672 [Auriculariales sp. MPI-PUGE-AT-0066]|nr:hypothetical protein BKA62DRAFT_714672 [Auriculariales sp. MPI-PUGE-AT-0066]